MSLVILIPAFNEEDTIAGVVRPALEADVGLVVVISDGSTDHTAAVASAAGAKVLDLSPNQGKGTAMLKGVQTFSEVDTVVFLDADLLGLRADHVRALGAPFAPGTVMRCALRDYGPILNKLQVGIPRITGERAVTMSVLAKVPESFWHGFRIEAGINQAAKLLGKTESFVMDGVSIRTKWQKTGDDGFTKGVSMVFDVVDAIHDAKTEIR